MEVLPGEQCDLCYRRNTKCLRLLRFFFNDTATSEIYSLSLHDALPIYFYWEVWEMNRKGFTLIELLIVVVIIGILAAIAIPKFANTKEKAYIASMKSDLRNLVTAEEAYFADSVKYTAAYGAGGVNFVQSTGNT